MKFTAKQLERLQSVIKMDGLDIIEVGQDIAGSVIGHVRGNIEGAVFGSVNGSVEGDVRDDVYGNVLGDVGGNVGGNLWGDVKGSVKGDSRFNNIQVTDSELLLLADLLKTAREDFKYFREFDLEEVESNPRVYRLIHQAELRLKHLEETLTKASNFPIVFSDKFQCMEFENPTCDPALPPHFADGGYEA